MHTLIIAEAGVNHNGDFEVAKKMIDAAKEAGVDIVKFQTSITSTSKFSEKALNNTLSGIKIYPVAYYQRQGGNNYEQETVSKLCSCADAGNYDIQCMRRRKGSSGSHCSNIGIVDGGRCQSIS